MGDNREKSERFELERDRLVQELRQANEALTLANAREREAAQEAVQERDRLRALIDSAGGAEERIRQLNQGLARCNAELDVERVRWKRVVQGIADEVWVSDAQGRMSLVNLPAVTQMGLKEFEDKSVDQVLEVVEILNPDGQPRPPEQAPLLRSLRGETFAGEEIMRHRGTGLTRWRQFSSAPVRDAVGTIVGAVAVVRDVTELHQLQNRQKNLLSQVQRRAAELKGVLDNMLDAVYVCDTEGRIVLVNMAGLGLLGLGQVEEIERALSGPPGLLRPRHLDGRAVAADEHPLARALQGKLVVQEDQLAYNPLRQHDVNLRVSASPIRDEKGEIVGAVAVARDVTEMIELDKMREGFVSVAAHELKTPVTVLKGFSQLLLRHSERITEEKQRTMLEAMDRGADRINAIVTDLLDISLLYLGCLELVRERVNLAALVSETVERMALTSSNHQIRLLRADPVMIQGDFARIEEVLGHLIENAITYSPEGGEIDLTLAVQGEEAVVSVRDQGIGIPKNKQPRIFQRFYRAHDGTPYDFGGLGVGLYIAKEIITGHGGRMWFESEEGKGSTFSFALPVQAKTHEAAERD